jgi:hypothetical protein
MLMSGAKHLAFSRCYEDEILRLRLRMTLRHSLFAGEGGLPVSVEYIANVLRLASDAFCERDFLF